MIFIAMEYFRELKCLCVGGSDVCVLLEKVSNPVFDGLAASRWNRYFIYLFILLLSLSFLSFFFRGGWGGGGGGAAWNYYEISWGGGGANKASSCRSNVNPSLV